MLAPTITLETTLAIREMNREDIPAVREMAGRIWRTHYVPDIVTAEQIEYMLPRLYSDEAILRNLIEKKQRFWLLYSGELLLGYAAVEPKGNQVWFIDKLYVDMDNQRLGLGSTLLAHILSQLHPAALTLRVNRKNFKAINFYFKHGFYIEALDVLDIGGGFVIDDFLMKKIL